MVGGVPSRIRSTHGWCAKDQTWGIGQSAMLLSEPTDVVDKEQLSLLAMRGR